MWLTILRNLDWDSFPHEWAKEEVNNILSPSYSRSRNGIPEGGRKRKVTWPRSL
jgi:hypothetical protein